MKHNHGQPARPARRRRSEPVSSAKQIRRDVRTIARLFTQMQIARQKMGKESYFDLWQQQFQTTER